MGWMSRKRCGLQQSGQIYRARGDGPLVSLVSVRGGNRCYLCESVEGIEKRDTVEIASIYAGVVHLQEKMVGYEKRLGEYPTLSAIF